MFFTCSTQSVNLPERPLGGLLFFVDKILQTSSVYMGNGRRPFQIIAKGCSNNRIIQQEYHKFLEIPRFKPNYLLHNVQVLPEIFYGVISHKHKT